MHKSGAVTTRSSGRICCRLFAVSLRNDQSALEGVLERAAEHGIAALAIDQPGSIAQLALVVARQRQVTVAYIPGLVMRRAADLYPGEAKTDRAVSATPTSSPTQPALATSRCDSAVTEGFIWAAHARLILRRLTEHTYD